MPKLPKYLGKGDVIDWAWVKELLDYIRSNAIKPSGNAGVLVKQNGLDGITLSLSNKRGKDFSTFEALPWTPLNVSDGAEQRVAFWPGFVNGQAPLVDGTSIIDDPAPYLVVTVTTSFWLKATVDAGDDVTGYEIIDSVSTLTSTYVPGTGGEAYLRIAQVIMSSGVIADLGPNRHFVRGNLLFGVGDGYLWTSTP